MFVDITIFRCRTQREEFKSFKTIHPKARTSIWCWLIYTCRMRSTPAVQHARIEERKRHVKRFRGRLVVKAHQLLYHSTLGSKVIKKKKKKRDLRDPEGGAPLQPARLLEEREVALAFVNMSFRLQFFYPLPSEKRTYPIVLRDLAFKARPEPDLDCLICAKLDRQRIVTHKLQLKGISRRDLGDP